MPFWAIRACWRTAVWKTIEILLIKQMQALLDLSKVSKEVTGTESFVCMVSNSLTLLPPLSSWESGGNKKKGGKRKIKWKESSGRAGTRFPVQSACGHRCFPSAQIECDLCQAQTLVSTLRVPAAERAAPLRNPALRWKHSPMCIMCMKIIRCIV